MFRHSRTDVFSIIKSTGLVPLFYHSDIETCKKIIEVCYKAGARAVEFTARGLFSPGIFEEISRYVSSDFPKLALGVGSITDAGAASLYIQLGADFIVTPVLREDIAIVCNRRKVLLLPGCGSLTEIARAEELGCEIIKLFPATTIGPEFVKAVKGPQPWTEIMATGGISPEEDCLKKWFTAGVSAVGIGSDLIFTNTEGHIDYNLMEERINKVLSLVEKIRN